MKRKPQVTVDAAEPKDMEHIAIRKDAEEILESIIAEEKDIMNEWKDHVIRLSELVAQRENLKILDRVFSKKNGLDQFFSFGRKKELIIITSMELQDNVAISITTFDDLLKELTPEEVGGNYAEMGAEIMRCSEKLKKTAESYLQFSD